MAADLADQNTQKRCMQTPMRTNTGQGAVDATHVACFACEDMLLPRLVIHMKVKTDLNIHANSTISTKIKILH